MIRDSDIPPTMNGETPESPEPSPGLVVTNIPFQHPPGFQAIGYLIIGISAEGAPFTNAPPNIPTAMALSAIGVQYVTNQALKYLETQAEQQVIVAPAHALPRWPYRSLN
jgi:hypothetical protein